MNGHKRRMVSHPVRRPLSACRWRASHNRVKATNTANRAETTSGVGQSDARSVAGGAARPPCRCRSLDRFPHGQDLADGSERRHLRAAGHQRADARLGLRADRHRLHDGLRHHRHDQLRPWRRLHDRRLPCPDPDPRARLLRHHLGAAGAGVRAGHRRGADGALRLDRGADRLPAAARLEPAGAADLCDRHVGLPAELRAAAAGRARQAAAPRDRGAIRQGPASGGRWHHRPDHA